MTAAEQAETIVAVLRLSSQPEAAIKAHPDEYERTAALSILENPRHLVMKGRQNQRLITLDNFRAAQVDWVTEFLTMEDDE